MWMGPTKPWWFPGWTSLREGVANAIGLGVIVFTAFALWPALMAADSAEGLKRAQDTFAILGSIVGAVIGFYFGSGAGERVAKDATQRTDQAKNASVEEVKAAKSELQAALDELAMLRAKLGP